MTPEQTWRSAKNPYQMLAGLKGLVGDRQLRLFAIACARLRWDLLSPQGREAVEAAERYLEDPAAYAAMIAAGMRVAATYQLHESVNWPGYSANPVDALARAAAYGDAWRAATYVTTTVSIPKVPKKHQEQTL